MDRLTPQRRSANMSRIRSTNTAPERTVRSVLHRLGYRFRLHDRSLPGTPDIVLPRWKTVILVHGCFWHRHPRCHFAYNPKSRQEFWTSKFTENVDRDRRHKRALKRHGWHVVTIWECQVAERDALATMLRTAVRRGHLTPKSWGAR